MVIMKDIVIKVILLILVSLITFACASTTYPPSLPAHLEIVPPSDEVAPEIAAFSGIWKGKWGGSALPETIIVIEKIDSKTAEVLFSIGGKEPGCFAFTADVLPGPIIKWVMPKFPKIDPKTEFECPCTMTFQLGKDSNVMIGYWEFNVYNFKLRGDLTKQ